MPSDNIVPDTPAMSANEEDSDFFTTNHWFSPPPKRGSNTDDDDSPPPDHPQIPTSLNPSPNDEIIYYNSDYSPPFTASTTTSSSPSLSPSNPFSTSSQLSRPLFPAPLASIAEIYPRWIRIVRLQKGYVDHYTFTHQHIGVANVALAKLDSASATGDNDADAPHGPTKFQRRTLWHSLRESDLQILEHAMLHVAHMTREKILLQRQATMLYKHAHQRELWRQRQDDGDDAVVYAVVEGWRKRVGWAEGVRRKMA